MRVVELQGDLVRQCGPVISRRAESTDGISQRAGHQKVLLQEPESLAFGGRIIWIQHASDRLGGEGFCLGADEVAMAELLKVEIIRRRSRPEPQRIDVLATVADDRPIV